MKKKILALVLIVFLITGCSVEYKIDITDNKIRIDGTLIEADSNNWEKVIVENPKEQIDHNADPNYCLDGSCSIEDGEEDNSSLTFAQLIDLKTINKETRIEGLDRIKDVGKLGISTKKTIDYKNRSDLKKIPGINTCYKNFSVVENLNRDGIVISTSTKNLCFEMYDILEEIKVKVKTNHEVESHNADEVVNGEYIWKINGGNYNNKSIQLTLLNKTHKKTDFNLLILLGGAILVIVAVIGFIVGNIYIKSNRVNTIK